MRCHKCGYVETGVPFLHPVIPKEKPCWTHDAPTEPTPSHHDVRWICPICDVIHYGNGELVPERAMKIAPEMVRYFEASMNMAALISNATQSQLETLQNKAKELSATPFGSAFDIAGVQFTAAQVADCMKLLAIAGLKPTKIIDLIEPTLKLTAAANLDFEQSVNIVTTHV